MQGHKITHNANQNIQYLFFDKQSYRLNTKPSSFVTGYSCILHNETEAGPVKLLN
jgi:hypothetical protein